jgi:adenylate kinase family enzyme
MITPVQRIAIIGNGGGGKSTLARGLARAWSLPRIEVDDVQFGADWGPLPAADVARALREAQAGERWIIIDGFGPWETIEERAARADLLVLVDLPLWVHCWWAAERQLAAARGEPVYGARAAPPTRDLFRAIGHVHEVLRPRLLALVERHRERARVLTTPEQVTAFATSPA